MKKIIKLAVADFKIIFRDPSLYSFLVLPVILYALLIWFVPRLVERYDVIVPYLPLFLVIGVVENTQVFSFINSMILIDEKETKVAVLYGIVPITNVQYVVSRFIFPFLITTIFNVGLIAVQPFYDIGFGTNLAISVLAALIVPTYVLGINSIVENRMQGMIWIKAFNILVLLPFAAFFVPEGFVHFFGFLPTHWIFQSIENVTAGESIVLMVIVGFLYFGLLLIWTARQFLKRHFVFA